MSLFKSLKKLTWKKVGKAITKIQPGKVIGNVATAAGLGGIVKAIDKGIAAGKKLEKTVSGALKQGETPAEVAEQIATDAANGLTTYADAREADQAAKNATGIDGKTWLLIGGGVLVLFLLMRGRR